MENISDIVNSLFVDTDYDKINTEIMIKRILERVLNKILLDRVELSSIKRNTIILNVVHPGVSFSINFWKKNILNELEREGIFHIKNIIFKIRKKTGATNE